MTTNTELTTEVNELPQLPVAYSAESLEDLFNKVKAEVEAHVPDLETVEGRKHIKSLAAKISSSKAAIDKPMRDYLREIKALPKVVEKNARESVERFDALRDATLKPLVDAQAAQDAIIARMGEIVSYCGQADAQSDTVRSMLVEAKAVDVESFWHELKKKASAEVDGATQIATVALARIEAAEQQAAELELLRKEAEVNAQKERDRVIAEAAAQKAREEEQQRAEQRILDERNKAEQSRLAQLKAEQDAANAEAQRIAADAKAIADADLAEQQAKERERIAAEQAAKYAAEQTALEAQRKHEEEDRRAADKAHRTKINREALVDLIAKAGIDEEAAKRVITAIAKGEVANMKVIY
ncbi:MAG: hypothetical protein ACRDE7_03575 [Sphingobacterium sp.]